MKNFKNLQNLCASLAAMFVLVFCFAAFSSSAAAQCSNTNTVISGTVTYNIRYGNRYSFNEYPLEGAGIWIQKADTGQTIAWLWTDASGNYTTAGTPANVQTCTEYTVFLASIPSGYGTFLAVLPSQLQYTNTDTSLNNPLAVNFLVRYAQ